MTGLIVQNDKRPRKRYGGSTAGKSQAVTSRIWSFVFWTFIPAPRNNGRTDLQLNWASPQTRGQIWGGFNWVV